MTYDEFADIAFTFAEVEEGLSYGSPAIKRKGRMMFGPKADGETVAIRLDWDTHDRLLEEEPEVFYKTPHYEGWPWLLIRLPLLDLVTAKALIECSWTDAPKAAQVKKGPPT